MEKHDKKSSSWSVVFNICCIAIGLGVLSFPFAFRCAGLLGGLILCFICGIVTAYCMNIVIQYSSRHNCNTFQDLVKCSIGSSTSWCVALLVIVYLYGSCVAYQIVVGDTFHPLMAQIIGSSDSFWCDRRFIIAVTGVFIVLPISLKRSAFHFAGVSSIAVVIIIFMGIVVLMRTINKWSEDGLQELEMFVWRPEIVYAIPIIIFAFQAHVQSCNLFFELDEDSQLVTFWRRQKRRTPSDSDVELQKFDQQQVFNKVGTMKNVVRLSFTFCGVVFTMVGVAGYVLHPSVVGSDIMNCLPIDDLFVQIVRGLVGLSALLHYPINQHVARAALHDFLANLFNWKSRKADIVPYSQIAICTVLFFVPCTMTAIMVRDLGIVFHLLGGIASACFIFVIPGVMLVLDKEARNEAVKSEREIDNLQDCCQALQVLSLPNNQLPPCVFQGGNTDKINTQNNNINNNILQNNKINNTMQLVAPSFGKESTITSVQFFNNNNFLNSKNSDQLVYDKQDMNQLISQNYYNYSFTSDDFATPLSSNLDAIDSSNNLTSTTSISSQSIKSDTYVVEVQIVEKTAQKVIENSNSKRNSNNDNINNRQILKNQDQRRRYYSKIAGVLLVLVGMIVVLVTIFTTLLEVFELEGRMLPIRPKAQFPCDFH